MGGFPKDKEPHGVRGLMRWLDDYQRATGIPRNRLQQWMSATITIAALEQAAEGPEAPFVLLKGGAAIERRFGLRARPSADVDLIVLAPPDLGQEQIRDALAQGWQDFTFSLDTFEQIHDHDSWRASVKVRYRGAPWQTVTLEISGPEGDLAGDVEYLDAFSLAEFGLPGGPERIPCLGLSYQIAQKLHACTERFPDRANARVRDLVDLPLLADLVEDWPRLRAACIDVFGVRGTHDWPPALEPEPGWEADYDALVTRLEVPMPSFDDALTRVRDLIARIDAS